MCLISRIVNDLTAASRGRLWRDANGELHKSDTIDSVPADAELVSLYDYIDERKRFEPELVAPVGKLVFGKVLISAGCDCPYAKSLYITSVAVKCEATSEYLPIDTGMMVAQYFRDKYILQRNNHTGEDK